MANMFVRRLLCEGITKITYGDIAYASSHGYRIKLLGRASRTENGKVYAMTAPYLVPVDNALAGINDVYNGILVVGNIVEDVLFCGRGAGSLPDGKCRDGGCVGCHPRLPQEPSAGKIRKPIS